MFAFEEYSLTGDTKRTGQALEHLRTALIGESTSPRSLLMVETNSVDSPRQPLSAHRTAIESIRTTKWGETEYIVIRPQPGMGLDIHIRATPLIHTDTSKHMTHVRQDGYCVHIVAPYYFYEDKHVVSTRKLMFYIRNSEE